MRARVIEYLAWLAASYANVVWAIRDLRDGPIYWAALWILGFFITFACAQQQADAIREARRDA